MWVPAFAGTTPMKSNKSKSTMAGYKLATYRSADGARAGLVVDEQVFDAAKLIGESAYATVLGILEDWRSAQGALRKAAAAGASKRRVQSQPLGRTKLLRSERLPSGIYFARADY